MAVSAKDTEPIHPDSVYPIQAFERAAGISPARRWEAKKQGVDLLTFDVGRRRFVRGVDAIDYLQRLSALGEPERKRGNMGVQISNQSGLSSPSMSSHS